MKTLSLMDKPDHRRKIHYVDETLQRFLLIGLVALEAALAGGLAWMMYRRLSGIVEDNLYRVHLADNGSILPPMLHEAVMLLAIFSLVNLVAVLAVDFIWRRHVASILRLFNLLMGKTDQLDFTADPEISKRHEVLDLAETQRERDRVRLKEIREQLSRLETPAPAANDARQRLEILQAVGELLPQHSP
jgi:hypothetical protein